MSRRHRPLMAALLSTFNLYPIERKPRIVIRSLLTQEERERLPSSQRRLCIHCGNPNGNDNRTPYCSAVCCRAAKSKKATVV